MKISEYFLCEDGVFESALDQRQDQRTKMQEQHWRQAFGLPTRSEDHRNK